MVDVETLLARAEISDVLARYVHAADRGDWQLLRSCYHSDAVDDHGPYSGDVDGLVDYVSGVSATLTVTTHQLGQQWVELDPGGTTARAETYCLAGYGRRSAGGSEWFILQALRYLDRFELRDGRWAIARRAVVMDWEHIAPVTQPARLGDWLRGSRGASDPSSALFPVTEAPAQAGARSTAAGGS